MFSASKIKNCLFTCMLQSIIWIIISAMCLYFYYQEPNKLFLNETIFTDFYYLYLSNVMIFDIIQENLLLDPKSFSIIMWCVLVVSGLLFCITSLGIHEVRSTNSERELIRTLKLCNTLLICFFILDIFLLFLFVRDYKSFCNKSNIIVDFCSSLKKVYIYLMIASMRFIIGWFYNSYAMNEFRKAIRMLKLELEDQERERVHNAIPVNNFYQMPSPTYSQEVYRIPTYPIPASNDIARNGMRFNIRTNQYDWEWNRQH